MTYRILALDGGGSWALIQVKALMKIYKDCKTGHDILKQFDLAAANSGGSIVLAGLLADKPLAELDNLFGNESIRRSIFSPTKSFTDRAIHWLVGVGPKYDAVEKLRGLRAQLQPAGDLPLARVAAGVESHNGGPLKVLITSFDYDRNRAIFFRSRATESDHWGSGDVHDVTLAEAVHGSTNAPVNYFDGPAVLGGGRRCWDGGVAGCNNPVLAAVAELIGANLDRNKIVALSIGTATRALPSPRDNNEAILPLYRQPAEPGLVNDLHKLTGAILDDPPDVASYLAHVALGVDGLPGGVDSRIVRLSPLISPVHDAHADIWRTPSDWTDDEFLRFMNIDMDAIDEKDVRAIQRFTKDWLNDATLNQPIRMNGDTLTEEIGKMRFSAALADWDKIKDLGAA